jgi:hypothetical protein
VFSPAIIVGSNCQGRSIKRTLSPDAKLDPCELLVAGAERSVTANQELIAPTHDLVLSFIAEVQIIKSRRKPCDTLPS